MLIILMFIHLFWNSAEVADMSREKKLTAEGTAELKHDWALDVVNFRFKI